MPTSAVSYVGGLLNIGTSGFDMVAVNPDNASSKQRISYLDGSAGGGRFTSDVLIYSTYGNVIIDSLATYPTREELNSAQDMQIPEARYNEMVSTMPLYLGCEPGINYYEKLCKGEFIRYHNMHNKQGRQREHIRSLYRDKCNSG
ncbi:MAG: hypothetical protein ACOX45_08140 [Acutalibacteraceae bacterium]